MEFVANFTQSQQDFAAKFDTGGGGGGQDGFSPIVDVTTIDGGHRVTITDKQGAESFDVMDGETPEKGVDYWTEEDKEEIAEQTQAQIDASTYTKSQTETLITEKVSEIVADAPEEFDTLKEMSDWLTNHAESAAAMNSAIQKNASDISALDDAKAEKSAVTAVTNDVNDINATLYPENKNLLKNTAISQTINGVTFTVNPDKSVTCNGTATENAFFVLGGTTHFSGSAITSGAPVGGGSKIWSIQIYEMVDGVETIRANDYGEGNTRTYTEGDYFGKIVIRDGQTVENLTFYPMLRYADTDDTYAPYKPTLWEDIAILKAELSALKAQN